MTTTKGRWFAVAWGDVNGDGNSDLFVGNAWGGKHALYLNSGNGRFDPVLSGDLVTLRNDAAGAVFADMNNDGKLDLFTANYGDPADDRLFVGKGDGTFERVRTGPPVGDTALGAQPVWLDFNRDGNLDLFVSNEGPLNFLYLGDGNGAFTPIKTGSLVTEQRHGGGAAVTDVNSDGFPDIFVAHIQAGGIGQNDTLYLNQSGTGDFTKISEGAEVTDKSFTFGVIFADLNNDGAMDIIAGHSDPGPHAVYLGDGMGGFTKTADGGFGGDTGRRASPAVGDFNNDGRLDVYFAHGNGDRNTLYLGNGDGTFLRVTSGVGSADGGGAIGSNSAAAADYDNDGWLDLAVANADKNAEAIGIATTCFLYHNEGGSDNGWVEFRLRGTQSNRSGIGARVHLEAVIDGQRVTQIREVSGGESYLSQPDQKLHFGLGDAKRIERVRVEWPSGYVQELFGMALRQIHTVVEPPKVRIIANGHVRVIGWKDTEYGIESSTDLRNWGRVGVAKGGAEYVDTQSSDPHRFYRAWVSP